MKSSPIVLAIVAHPDDVEFNFSGTLMRLGEAGAELHIWNLADGSGGSVTLNADTIAAVRAEEARSAAASIGATAHPPLFPDLGIFYDAPSLARVAAGIRQIRPTIILTHPLADYMEDHQNAARLAVTGAFARGVPNFVTEPPQPAYFEPVALYHALPHGLRGPLGEAAVATHFVRIDPLMERKRHMLAFHRSQREWLQASQGMDAYLDEMERLGLQTGALSGVFAAAEGFTRHNPLGFGPPDWDPLSDLLGANVSRRLFTSPSS